MSYEKGTYCKAWCFGKMHSIAHIHSGQRKRHSEQDFPPFCSRGALCLGASKTNRHTALPRAAPTARAGRGCPKTRWATWFQLSLVPQGLCLNPPPVGSYLMSPQHPIRVWALHNRSLVSKSQTFCFEVIAFLHQQQYEVRFFPSHWTLHWFQKMRKERGLRLYSQEMLTYNTFYLGLSITPLLILNIQAGAKVGLQLFVWKTV